MAAFLGESFKYSVFNDITMKQELKLKSSWEKVCHDIEQHVKDTKYAKALDEFIRLTS